MEAQKTARTPVNQALSGGATSVRATRCNNRPFQAIKACRPLRSHHNSSARCASAPEHTERSAERLVQHINIDRRTLLAGAALAPLLAIGTAEAAILPKGAKVFVAGATGQTGSRVVKQLSEKGYQVFAGARDRKKAAKAGFDSSVQIVEFNLFDPESIAAAIGDADGVVSALGYSGFNLEAYKDVDLTGTVNLIEGAKKASVKKFVLLTSLLTNAKAIGQQDNNNYKFLNAFGGVLDNKLEAEKQLRASGLDWTIVRPGGLSNETPDNLGGVYVSKEDTLFGLDGDPGRSISRDTVAQFMAEALSSQAAANKVVEIVQGKTLPQLPVDKYFDV